MNRYEIENKRTGEIRTVYAFLAKWAIKGTGWAADDCRILQWTPVG